MRPFTCALSLLFIGCGPTTRFGNPPGGPAASDPNRDRDGDGDGYTPAQGDCNDDNRSINPGAIQVPGDATDYACNGMAGVVSACDGALAGSRDPASLTRAFDACDPRFWKSATLLGPSDQRARKVVSRFGVLQPRGGQAMALLSSGIAADKNDPDFDASVAQDPGTELGGANSSSNPLPALPGAAGCSQSQPAVVNDYTELVVKLVAPTNANSFSFDFQFFSAEYPVYVCTEFNDEFLVLQESAAQFVTPTNIAFDKQKNPVTVNNGFFTVCTNDPRKPQTQHCTHPVSDIAGTEFGGSTGWLTTTSPVSPGEAVTLHFIIFDEGDHVLDSAALIDNFRWGVSVVQTPTTTPIQ
ncbi:MAG TPA: choice-of-anchor L domain-containing protein [Kofleriaceae bacterium]|nr:choice-of-anchor L domain-containing protein [Kofleriaceae bacterium]